jgi:hypothetical protein
MGYGGGTGGAGGGGTSGSSPTPGGINLGGGGGAGYNTYPTSPWNRPGAAGGSGVLILRYADTFAAATSTTGSPTVTVTGGYRIYKFTSSGSITF